MDEFRVEFAFPQTISVSSSNNVMLGGNKLRAQRIALGYLAGLAEITNCEN